ncbi:MAG: type II secretion system GspH family protein [Phycisphaerales bacterium]|nr:prepilin-type N-terminal cleavage/methylation domain-containing protein [Planctomycetota bacterium]MCH8507787.1 type II secretion system GspH family protein [Phycisphaerales bacterium]
MRHARAAGARAFTLIETVVAVSISSVLLLALGSAVLVASRAVPTGNETVITAGWVERGIEQIRSDLEEAIGIVRDSDGFHIAVPDRTGDGIGEVISYTNMSGGLLGRAVNMDDPRPILGPLKDTEIVMTQESDRIKSVRLIFHMEHHTPAARVLEVRLLNTPEVP